MGEHRRRRPTLPRQRRLGVARDPMKLRRSSFGAASVIAGETQAIPRELARANPPWRDFYVHFIPGDLK